ERRVVAAEDRREPDGEQQRGEGGGHADVVDRPDAERAGGGAIERRVAGQQHEVVQQQRGEEPGEHVVGAAHVDELQDRPARGRERDRVRGEVQRGGAVGAPHTKVILATHFVQCTPGRAGTMTRAGKPWSSDRSAPLPRSASSARWLVCWAWSSVV